jgi:uncharacterized protein
MIQLHVFSVGILEGTDSVVVVLRAPDMRRLLPMQIGLLEARAITLEIEQVKTPRPLTHELVQRAVEHLGARVERAFIREFKDNIFFADLVLTRRDGSEVTVDTRPSDAIAVALRSRAPIFADLSLMLDRGVPEEADPDEDGGEDRDSAILH